MSALPLAPGFGQHDAVLASLRAMREYCPHKHAADVSQRTTLKACEQIALIPAALFDERALMNLIGSIQSQLARCSWAHREHCNDAGELLDDLHSLLENAAEASERES